MDENIIVLNEIHKGLVMGMESISVVSSKVGDKAFKNVLETQYKEYDNLLNKVNCGLEGSRKKGRRHINWSKNNGLDKHTNEYNYR
ncbi:MAG: hypothetical protein IKP28_02120 [Clostridia bacterium]|nr:hypothetical protein [Clostridia bacterium]